MIECPCKSCKGHLLTYGRCHSSGKCKRYEKYRCELKKAKKDVEKSAQDAVSAKRYSG